MKKYLLPLAFFFLAIGCETQTEEAVDWGMLDAGDFTILTPSGWQFTPEMGIDSTIGKFSDGEMTLIFDYGMYTGDFENNSVYFEDPSAYTVIEETINELEAKIYVPNEASTEKPTVLFIKNPRGVGPCTEGVCGLSEENFEMLGDNLNEEEVDLAIQIFKTVDFNNVEEFIDVEEVVAVEETESVEESPPDSITVHSDFDYISDSLTKYLIWWGEEVAMVENCPGGYYEGYGDGSGIYFCEDTENRWLQFEWLDGTEVRVPGDAGDNFLWDYRSSGGSTFQWTMTDDEKYWIYLDVWSSDEYQLISYDVAAAKEEVLMSFLAMDYDYGCSGNRFFGWNPDHTKLGIVVNNEKEDAAYPTNTKVFILTIEDGKLTNKSKYDLRVLPDCTPNNGPFFAIDWVDNDTIGYYDPSDYSDSEYLETLFWSDDPWGSEYAKFYDVR